MLKVECEVCSAPYKVDERRVPPGGLKMRCPKCGTTFVVRKEQESAEAPKAKEPAPTAAPLRSDASKRTMMGVGFPGLDATGAPIASNRPAPAPAPFDDSELDLPVVGPPNQRNAPAFPDADLPAATAKRMTATTPAIPAQRLRGGDVTRREAPASSPRAPAPSAPSFNDDIGLPVVGGAPSKHAGLPAVAGPRKAPPPPKISQKSQPNFDADLPDVPLARDLDLPARPQAGRTAQLDSFSDLPLAAGPPRAELPSPRSDLPNIAKRADVSKTARQITGAALGFGTSDLPAVSALPPATITGVPKPAAKPGPNPFPVDDFGDGFGELDLPLVASSDLPSPTQAELPSPFRNDNLLPTVSAFNNNLPSVGSNNNLPATPEVSQHLPVASAQLADSDWPPPKPPQQQARPDSVWPEPATSSSVPPFGSQASLTPPPPQTAAIRASSPSFSDIGLPGNSSIPQARSTQDAQAVTRQAGGGTNFGEVDLGGEAGNSVRPAPRSNEDDMEFGAIPQEKEETGSETAQLGTSTRPPSSPSLAPAQNLQSVPLDFPVKRSKVVKIVAISLVALVLGGGALVATPFGAFGYYIITDTIRAKDYDLLLQSTIDESRRAMATDTNSRADASLTDQETAIAKAPRFAPLAAYAAFSGFLREVRFGADPAVHAHATTLLGQATKNAKDAQYLSLARAAEAAALGQVAKAKQAVAGLARRGANDIDIAVLEGEVALLAGEAKPALEAWERGAKLEKSPRVAFGKARAYYALEDSKNAEIEARKAIESSAEHVGARILLARILLKSDQEDKAVTVLDEILKSPKIRASAGRSELVSIHTLVGQVHLVRSRMSLSEAAFAEALKLNPKDGDALCGFGEVLFREGRYAEALARYEAGVQANPESVDAKIGAAKTKISLERLQEAKDLLRKLRETRPADPSVAYWLAQVEDALGNKADVEKILTDAIARNPTGTEAIRLYVALSLFLAAQGRTQEAEARLAEARKKLPDVPAIHKALGDVALTAGRFPEAKAEFEISIQKDPQDLSSVFHLGVTLRRMSKFDEAQAVFDRVSAADKNYPGLALERGVLFEASGQAQRALEMYQEALSKAPNDPDLMLRVGSAEVAAGHAAQAEEVLRKVLQARPNSAEANHYLGRSLLLKGTNLAEALRYLKRAIEIDPHRAEYWLFIGWAANDAGQPSVAQDALRKALDLDQSLADAYWQRGVLERRQGAVRDAEKDLVKALELKPSRFEAHATLAECHEDQAEWSSAISEWRKAISSDGTRSFWRYKIGRLLYNNNGRAAAAEELTQAVQLASKESRPPWLWEAYLMLGEHYRTANRKNEAIDYYRQFLKLSPPDSPYRVDALKYLGSVGASYDN